MGVEVLCTSPSAYCVHLQWFATHSILSPSAPVNTPLHFAQLYSLEDENLKMKALLFLKISGNTHPAPQSHIAEVLNLYVLYVLCITQAQL